jgi:hypothetical protein
MGESEDDERRCLLSYCIHLYSEAISPITHMKGVEGNEALIAREPVDTPSGIRSVPFLSANAIRHKFVREPGGLYLIHALGLNGKLSLKQLNFLLHGGNLTDSTGRENTARIAEMQELFPLLRLLGGALPDQILKGSLLAWRGMLVCEENRRHMSLPEGYSLPAESLKPSEHYVSGYQYTRGDAAKSPELYDPAKHDPEAKSNLMIFSGGTVIRGAAFLHGFDIPHGSELEYGCLLHALECWQEDAGGTIGGMASKGHGRLKTSILAERDDSEEMIAKYISHVEKHAEPCRAWLEKVFKAKEEKTPAEPKKKGKKSAPLTEESDG